MLHDLGTHDQVVGLVGEAGIRLSEIRHEEAGGNPGFGGELRRLLDDARGDVHAVHLEAAPRERYRQAPRPAPHVQRAPARQIDQLQDLVGQMAQKRIAELMPLDRVLREIVDLHSHGFLARTLKITVVFPSSETGSFRRSIALKIRRPRSTGERDPAFFS